MMMTNRVIMVLAGLILPFIASAQDSDFGLWYEVTADYKIIKKLRLDAEASIRTNENGSNIETFYFEPGIRYRFNDYFAAGIYYRFIEQQENDDKFHPRHRWFVQLKGSLPVKRFTFSVRYRIQEQFKTYIEDPGDEIPVWLSRTRLELDYDIKGVPLKPYANAEMGNELNTSNDIFIDKWRYIAGLEYSIKKKHSFCLEYIFNGSKVSKPERLHSIGVRYSLSL